MTKFIAGLIFSILFLTSCSLLELSDRYEVKELVIRFDRVIFIEGIIQNDIMQNLKTIQQWDDGVTPIYLMIKSPGGSVPAGMKFIKHLQKVDSPIITICNEGCYSMAAILMQVGDQRYMTTNAIQMHHKAWGYINDDIENIVKWATQSLQMELWLSKLVADRVGLSLENYRELMKDEYWIGARAAVHKNFADSIVQVKISEIE